MKTFKEYVTEAVEHKLSTSPKFSEDHKENIGLLKSNMSAHLALAAKGHPHAHAVLHSFADTAIKASRSVSKARKTEQEGYSADALDAIDTYKNELADFKSDKKGYEAKHKKDTEDFVNSTNFSADGKNPYAGDHLHKSFHKYIPSLKK